MIVSKELKTKIEYRLMGRCRILSHVGKLSGGMEVRMGWIDRLATKARVSAQKVLFLSVEQNATTSPPLRSGSSVVACYKA